MYLYIYYYFLCVILIGFSECGVLEEARENLRKLLNHNITKLSNNNFLPLNCVNIKHMNSKLTSTCCITGGMTDEHLDIGCLPSLIIGGFQKAGTTAFASLLSSTLNITFSSRKEIHFFDNDIYYNRGLLWYLRQFPKWNYKFHDWNDPPIFAEATPFYISSSKACQRISQVLPNVLFVILLRNPVTRTYSEWHMKKRRVDNQLNFTSLVNRHFHQIRDCFVKYSHNFSHITSCVPQTLSNHDEWIKFTRFIINNYLRSSSGWNGMMQNCFHESIKFPQFSTTNISYSYNLDENHAMNMNSIKLLNITSQGSRNLEYFDDSSDIKYVAKNLAYRYYNVEVNQCDKNMISWNDILRDDMNDRHYSFTNSIPSQTCIQMYAQERIRPFNIVIEEEVYHKCINFDLVVNYLSLNHFMFLYVYRLNHS